MKKMLTVARWEFVEKVRTKSFIVSLFLTPLMLIGFTMLPAILAQQEEEESKVVGVIDVTGEVYSALEEKINEYKLADGEPGYILVDLLQRVDDPTNLKQDANMRVLESEMSGYLLINGSLPDSLHAEYTSESVGNFALINNFENALSEILHEAVIKKYNIDMVIAEKLTTQINIRNLKVDAEGREQDVDFQAQFFTTIAVMMLLVFIILSSGGMLVRSLAEEKSNRLIEIIVSSCQPRDLLGGKVIAMAGLIFTQMFIWVAVGIAVAGAYIVLFISTENLLLLMLYFVLCFVFYTALFVGTGSMVNTDQEAQQINGYLAIFLLIPVVLIVPLITNPDSLIIKIFSFIPFTTPHVMMARLTISNVPAIELMLSIFVMLLSVYLAIAGAARIFRIGILSYGKTPSFKELLKWLRKPE